MNLMQVQNDLKDLSDKQLQGELLQPSGAAPSFLVLSELNRRKDARQSAAANSPGPQGSIADEFTKGVGQANVGNYAPAMRGAANPQTPPQSAGDMTQPPSPQDQQTQASVGFASGGGVPQTGNSGRDMALNSLAQWLGPSAVRQLMGDQPTPYEASQAGLPAQQAALSAVKAPAMQGLPSVPTSIMATPAASGVDPRYLQQAQQGFADGGPVSDYGYTSSPSMSYADRIRELARIKLNNWGSVEPVVPPSGPQSSDPTAIMGDTNAIPAWMKPNVERGKRALMGPTNTQPPASGPDIISEGIPAAMRAARDPSTMVTDPAITIPGDKMQVDPRAYPPPNMRPLFERDPGQSLGQTWSNRMTGRSPNSSTAGVEDWVPDGVPPRGKTAGVPGAVSVGPGGVGPGGQGYGGPDPVAYPEGGQGYGGPDPMLNQDDPRGNPLPGAPGPARMGAAGGGGGGGAGGPSGGAGNNSGLAAYMDMARSVALPDRFGELAARNQSDRDKLESNKENDRGMALLSAGLGIMGGTSPIAAVNIGQGAQAGVKYWNDAQKEMRIAEQGIRAADNQIAIAQANRDEKQLDTGMKLYQTSMDIHQRALDRAANKSIAGGQSAERLALAKMTHEDMVADRTQQREQAEINGYAGVAKDATAKADNIDTKIATLEAKRESIMPGMGGDTAALDAQLAKLRVQAEQHRSEATDYANRYKDAVDSRYTRKTGQPPPHRQEAPTAPAPTKPNFMWNPKTMKLEPVTQ